MSRASETKGGSTAVIDRHSGKAFTETVLGGRLLQLAYGTSLRPVIRTVVTRTGMLSRILGWYSRTGMSRRSITSTIDELGIDVNEFLEPADSYRSFHDFFIRRLKDGCRPFDAASNVFSSPADARLTVIPKLDGCTAIPVKGCQFEVDHLLARDDAAFAFADGAALVFRLCPADYHRFHFPAAGAVADRYEISGRYDSVHPMALDMGLPIFTENRRVVSLLDLETFGRCAYVEVAAFGVGGITQTHDGDRFEKMDEKGYFHFGASTLVLLLKKGSIRIDSDLAFNSLEGLETLVRVGETIGRQHSRV